MRRSYQIRYGRTELGVSKSDCLWVTFRSGYQCGLSYRYPCQYPNGWGQSYLSYLTYRGPLLNAHRTPEHGFRVRESHGPSSVSFIRKGLRQNGAISGLKVQWTDASGAVHRTEGPAVYTIYTQNPGVYFSTQYYVHGGRTYRDQLGCVLDMSKHERWEIFAPELLEILQCRN